MFHIAGNAGDFSCETEQEVEKIIISGSKKPYDELWISGQSEYPCLTVLVNGDLANVHYFAKEDGPMWQSAKREESGAEVDFLIGGQMGSIPSCYVIALELALASVRQFCETLDRPDCIAWEEL